MNAASPAMRRPPRRPAAASALLLGLSFAACAGGGRVPLDGEAGIPPEENTPAHQACRAEARRDPAVRALDRQYNPMNEYNALRISQERNVAEVAAYRTCLRREGLAVPGGVEAVRLR
jgi:hypothetical protein